MFFQPPDEEKPQQNIVKSRNSRKKRKKKKNSAARSIKQEISKKTNGFVSTMSSWAEHFTTVATWQLKHELAQWKARAKSLEYENDILHGIIRKNCMDTGVSKCSDSTFEQNGNPDNEHSHSESDNDDDSDQEEECSEQNECEFEVSEEFIQFVQNNAKFKEDARLERERLKASNEETNAVDEMEAGPSKPRTNDSTDLKELYGENWQRIAALEMSLHSQFTMESDKSKTTYWPNIPLNFS